MALPFLLPCQNAKYLAKGESYHQTLENCRYDLYIRTIWG